MPPRATAKEKTTKKKKMYYCTMQISNKCKNRDGMLEESDFYKSYSLFNKNGRFHICKECMKEFIYDKNQEIDMKNFKIILRICDIPFLKNVYENSINAKGETIGTYFKLIGLNYSNANWDCSDDMDNAIINPMTDKITDEELYKRWGNFSMDDLIWLESDYSEWITNHDCDKLSVRRLVQRICIKELELRKAQEKGLPTDKLEKAYLDLLNSGNLTPRTMNATNETESTKTFGVWLRDIEKTRPCEYFEDKKLYEDYDRIKEYIDRFLFRPLKNLITGSRDFDKEFQSLELNDFDEDMDDEDNE